MKRLYTDIYQRGNDYDQAEIFTKAPCGPYVTIEMLNAIVNKLIDLINQKQDDLNLGYIDYDGDTFLHDVNDSSIYAEAASNAINDENGENIAETYLKKVDQTYQYNSSGEIVGINNSAIYCGGKGAKELVGADGIYIEDDLTANIIGISANYVYASSLSGYQPKLTEEQMIDIESIPLKLNTFDFEETISSYATLDDLYDTLSGYYKMDETSGANELSAAFNLKQNLWTSVSVSTLTTSYNIANNTVTRIENNNVNDIIEFNITGLSSNEVPNVSVEFINNQVNCNPVFKNNNVELLCNTDTCYSGKSYMFRALGSMSEIIEMRKPRTNVSVNGTDVSVNGNLITP